MEKLQPKTGIKKRKFKNPGPGSHRQFGINNKGFYIILVAKTPSASTFWLLRHKEDYVFQPFFVSKDGNEEPLVRDLRERVSITYKRKSKIGSKPPF